MSDGRIIFDTSLNRDGLKSGLNGVKSDLSGLKSMFAGLGKVALAAFSVKAIINFGRECVTLGSNVAEVQNVVDTAFGDMKGKIEDFAKSSVQNFGISKLSAKKTASTYMAMAKGMGMEEKAASDMAISLTGLTGDVASFYNISQELADTKLKSVFTGETETLKDLGVVMTQANLNAYAMANGFGKTVDKMTQAEAVQLRYAYVTDQLRLASGDFLKTQDSWANQTRILSEQVKELMSILGQGMIQILTPLVRVLNQIVGYLISVANAASAAMSALFGKEQKSYKQTAKDIAGAAKSQEALTEATEESAEAAKSASLGFDELNVISQDGGATSGGSSSGSAVTSVGSGNVEDEEDQASKGEAIASRIKTAFGEITGLFRNTFTPSINAWGQAFGNLWPSVQTAVTDIKEGLTSLWNDTLGPLFRYVTGDFIPNIVNSFSTNLAPIFSDVLGVSVEEFGKDFIFICDLICQYVNDILIPAYRSIETAVTDVFGSCKKTWDDYGGSLVSKFREMKEGIREIWTSVYDAVIKPVADVIGEKFQWLWKEHLKPFVDNCLEFFAAFGEAVLAVWNNYLQPLVKFWVNVLGPTVTNVINTIMGIAGTLFAYVVDVVSGLIRSLKGIMNFITGVFTGDWKKAWTGIKDFLGGIWDMIWGSIKAAINLIIDGLNALWGGIYSTFAGIANGIGSALGWLGEFFGKDWEFSLPSKPPYIPKLAQGAVIPPNRQFLAVLGDQKSGTNIETPLDTMIQAFKTAMVEGGYGGGDAVINLTATLDGDVIYRNQERIRQKRGTQTVMTGSFAR